MKNKLMERLLTAVASTDDIYTDAPEKRAAVAAAKNLSVLAGTLTEFVSTRPNIGTVFADGEQVGVASVDIDGTVFWVPPDDLDRAGRKWSLELQGCTGRFAVTRYVTGDSADDERWVVSDVSAFYRALLAMPEAP